MKKMRKIIEIDEELCNGCGECVPDCAEGSLQIVDGKAKLVADKLCDGLGACLGSCPTGALKIIEREADEFDEEAVEKYLESKRQMEQRQSNTLACGCPSTVIQSIPQARKEQSACQAVNKPGLLSQSDEDSSTLLSHWPIQIRLVPPSAEFLKDCDLLVAADCTAVAARGFQERYLSGKTVLMGCPKFDDAEDYIQRFADIITHSDIRSLTILIMEVPCCLSMTSIIKKAIEKAEKEVPVKQITISLQGQEMASEKW